MAWTPPSDAVVEKKAWTPPADAVVGKADPAPKEEPGWFQPGSKSEALVRGFSQGATLGFGDEIQALVRSIGTPRSYEEVRDEERNANAAAASTNPGTYLAGNVAAALPGGLAVTGLKAGAKAAVPSLTASIPAKVGIVQTAKRGAALGAAQGLGSGEGSVGEQALSTAAGAGLGAAVPAGISAANYATRGAAATVAGSNLTNSGLKAIGSTEAQRRSRDAAAGAIAGGVTNKATGGSFMEGAAAGGVAGFSGVPVSRIVKVAAPAVRGAVDTAGRSVAGTGAATALALQQLSGQQKRAIRQEGDAKIQAAVSAGTPSYAATFMQKQDPAYRAATQEPDTDVQTDDEDDEE